MPNDIVRYKPGEVQRRARSIVSQANEEWYEKKKQEFSLASDMMYVSILKQGEILDEMRHRSPSFITRLSSEVGDSEERLNLLADFYQYFRDRLPRQDINLQYYLQICRSVRLIGSTWQEHDDIITDAIVLDEAVELIAGAHPERGDTPRVLADRLEERFGITAKGNRPFAGLSVSNTIETEELVERFHEVVRPLFLQFVANLTAKKSLIGTNTQDQTQVQIRSKVILTLNITIGMDKELTEREVEKLASKIRELINTHEVNSVKVKSYYAKRH